MENAFRDGEIKTSGTDIDKFMPPISRFGGNGRSRKKQDVVDKLKTFFETYFGIGVRHLLLVRQIRRLLIILTDRRRCR